MENDTTYMNQPQIIGFNDHSGLEAVSSVRPAAPYLGGKRQLAKTIIERINQILHQTYAEPFVGMGGVFFRRTMRPKAEIINDFSGDVANLFRILQRHYVPFLEMFRFQLTTRKDSERLAAILKGKFIMSIGDTPEVRQIFKGFHLEEVAVTYTANNAGKKRAGELLISGSTSETVPFIDELH